MPEARALEPAAGRGPIFIIGSMGSGTTLLRLMLDSHEHIAIPHETGFMRAYNAMKFIPFKWTGRGWARRLGWSDEEFDVEAARFFDRMFMRYVEEHGKRRWGEKTPLHTWHITGLARLFPDAVFVGIVRHPGACAASNMSRFRQPLVKTIRHYSRYNRELARQMAQLDGRFVLLRYEDLVLRTEPVMRELLDWLGEPWSDQVMQHHVVQGQREHARIEGKSRADDPIDVSRIDKWTRALGKDDKKVLRRRLGRLAAFYGYSATDAAALEPITERDSLLVGGAEIDARIERFPDLDLRTQPNVPIFERQYSPRKVWLVVNETGMPPNRAPQPPPPSAARRAASSVLRRLPGPARRRIRAAARPLRRGASGGRVST